MLNRRLISLIVFLCCLFSSGRTSCSYPVADTEQELRTAVNRLNSWLGVDANARRWRQYLNLNVLDAQAALGFSADPNELFEISNRVNSNADGLNHPIFRQVSAAIDAHLHSLSQRHLDVMSQLAASRNSFVPATLSDLDELRDRAIYEIRLLKKYYKQTITSRPRALLYYELRPDEAVSFLETMPFELPPLRGREQIQQEIEQAEEQIKSIEEQIRLLNEQRSQIEQWLDRLREEGGVNNGDAPPQPDNGPKLENQTDLTSTVDPVPADPASTAPKQDQLEQIDSARTQLQRLKQELEQRIESLQAEIAALRQSEQERLIRFRQTVTGLDLHLARFNDVALQRNDAYFARAHQSLIALRSRYQLAANPNTPRTYLRQLDDLIEQYQLLLATNDRRAAAKVGNLLGWIDNAGQVSGVTAAIKSRFSKPNFHLAVSSRLANSFAARSVRTTERVNENIIGRLARGLANVDGMVTVQFQPDPYQLHAAIDFSGGIDTSTYTPAGKMTAYAGSRSDFTFRRDIFGNVGGLFASDVYGDLQLNTWFKGITSRLQLVQQIAFKQYCKTKALSESISRERTIERIKPQFAAQTDEALEQGYLRFEDILRPQTEFGRWLPALYLHSTGNQLVVSGQHATPYDLGATNLPRAAFALGSDLEVRIHESMLSNYVSPLVAGKRLTNKEIADQLQALLQDVDADDDVDPALPPADPEEEFSITFADARPIQFEFEDSKFGVTISGQRFTREDQQINDAMRITLTFKIINNAGRMQLIPADEPRVELIDGPKNIRNVSFMSFLEDQLELALEKAFEDDVILPENLIPMKRLPENVQEVASTFQLTQLRTQQGWLYGGWSQMTPGMYFVQDLPAVWSPPEPDDQPADVLDPIDAGDAPGE